MQRAMERIHNVWHNMGTQGEYALEQTKIECMLTVGHVIHQKDTK